jgi:hypothetical protein
MLNQALRDAKRDRNKLPGQVSATPWLPTVQWTEDAVQSPILRTCYPGPDWLSLCPRAPSAGRDGIRQELLQTAHISVVAERQMFPFRHGLAYLRTPGRVSRQPNRDGHIRLR